MKIKAQLAQFADIWLNSPFPLQQLISQIRAVPKDMISLNLLTYLISKNTKNTSNQLASFILDVALALFGDNRKTQKASAAQRGINKWEVVILLLVLSYKNSNQI